MIYIMVTNWESHWDKLKGNSTYYTTRMLQGAMNERKLQEKTKTIFLRRNKNTRELEKTWSGTVSRFNKSYYKGKERISFNVFIEKEIQCPSKYTDYFEGWYIDEEDVIAPIPVSKFDPNFFSDLMNSSDWLVFEEYTYYLIKCLGIHTTHRFPPLKQKGQPDGFFKFNNLAVLYDCTLDSGFMESKAVQIENFCDQLKKGTIEYYHKKSNIRDCEKYVWIITRSVNNRLIKQVDEISVKEISVQKLMELYRKRIEFDMDESALETELRIL
ncbi:hypothetical protein ACFL0H_00165 [Thermodesulfobacteriota bacterium]